MIAPVPNGNGYVYCERHGRGGRPGWACPLCPPGTPAGPARAPLVRTPPAQAPRARSASRGAEDEATIWKQLVAVGLDAGCVRQYAWALDADPPRKFAADFAWPADRLIVEVVGGVHTVRKQWRSDVEREALAVALGWRVLPVHSGMIDDGTAIIRITSAFHNTRRQPPQD